MWWRRSVALACGHSQELQCHQFFLALHILQRQHVLWIWQFISLWPALGKQELPMSWRKQKHQIPSLPPLWFKGLLEMFISPLFIQNVRPLGPNLTLVLAGEKYVKLCFRLKRSQENPSASTQLFPLMPHWSRDLSPEAKACNPALCWTSERCGSILGYLGQGDHCFLPVTGCLNQMTLPWFVMISQSPRSLSKIHFERHSSILI